MTKEISVYSTLAISHQKGKADQAEQCRYAHKQE